MHPLIGITADLVDVTIPGLPTVRQRAVQALTYVRGVEAAGGTPVLLPAIPALAERFADACDGLLFTGGEDIDTRPMGIPLHPAAKIMHPERQAFETALLRAVDRRPHRPVLGVCLGMQQICVHRGGKLNQHLPDSLPTAERHAGDFAHPIAPVPGLTTRFLPLPAGNVASNHHQSIDDAGPLRVLARSDDGVIEAVDDPARPFYLAVQWHPERTADPKLGVEIFKRLIDACRRR